MFSNKTINTPLYNFMNRFLTLLLFIFLVSCGGDDPQPIDPTTPIVDPNIPVGSGNNDVLVWSEVFDYEGQPDKSKWVIEFGNGDWGWGNGEIQYYHNENLNVSDGTLKITAKKEPIGNSNYSSGRMKTQGNYSFRYGKMEVKAKLPASQGTWPAIWLLGNTFSSLGWPACGEIDLMEQTGYNKEKILGTVHWKSGQWNAAHPDRKDNHWDLEPGVGEIALQNLHNEFHIYTLNWTSSQIKMYIDDTLYYTINTNTTQPFDDPFFIILNVAMGGTLGGPIDPNFTEDVMEIDYVRVYQ